MSVLKERDWLEEMATKGWQLCGLNLGIRYHFKEITPTEKVYDIERFALNYSRNAKKQELEARKTALDIATQTGWEVAAVDESLNYYFVKDKTNDGYDELYDDDEMRQKKAEKYRSYLSIEQPKQLTMMSLLILVIYSALFLLLGTLGQSNKVPLIVLMVVLFINSGCTLMGIIWGQKIYKELSMSREHWELIKKYSVKKSFGKINELIEFLEEKDKEGLRLVEFDKKTYLFEEAKSHYTYYADTKSALKRRMKMFGKRYKNDYRDLEQLGTHWQEMSMDEARQLGLEVVCSVENGTIIYRCNKEKEVRWETGASKTTRRDQMKASLIFFIICFLIGFVYAFIKDMLT